MYVPQNMERGIPLGYLYEVDPSNNEVVTRKPTKI